MSIEIVILQIVAISCIAILLRSKKNQGWSLVAASILIIMAIGWRLKAQWTVGLVATLWTVGIGLPIFGMAQIAKLRSNEKYFQARRIANIVRILHPGDGWWTYPQTLQALGLAHQGNLDGALKILEPMQSIDNYDGRLAIATIHSLQAKWYAYLNIAETQLTKTQRSDEASSAGLYLRSLGETRQLDQLLVAVKECHLRSGKSGNIALVLLSKLYAFAFTGQTNEVKQLLNTGLNDYSNTSKRFWIATADWYAGNFEIANPEFEALQQLPSCELKSSLEWRSSQAPIRSFQLLNLESRSILSNLQRMQQEDLKYNPRNPTTMRQVPLTYAIVAVNCLIYAIPFIIIYGMVRSDIVFNLQPSTTRIVKGILDIYDWGALVPDQLFAGAWWQPLTAMFLHDPSSIVHLLFNMLGLMIVGAFVESRLGTLRYAIAYFTAGIGSMILLAILSRMTGAGSMSAIGASGAIMGMIGVMAAIYWKGWRKGDLVAKQWLRSIALIVLLQTAFDAVNPNVSGVGHLGGLFLGALVGLGLVRSED